MIDPAINAIYRFAEPKGEFKNLRALQSEMQQHARDLNYIFGSDADGRMLRLGMWRWGSDGMPELPRLPSSATPRQARDHRLASALRDGMPPLLLGALLTLREAIAHGVAAEIELREEGYARSALDKQRVAIGRKMVEHVRRAVTDAASAANTVAEYRQKLASEGFDIKDVDRYLATLGLAERAKEPADEASATIQSAIFDVAIVQSLKPLTQVESAMLREDHNVLPKQIDDPRVLQAIFRAPRPLLPYSDADLRQIARVAFMNFWPQVAAVSTVVEAMLEQLRIVAAEALRLAGRFLDGTNPYNAFREVEHGRWALELLIDEDPRARETFEDLGFS